MKERKVLSSKGINIAGDFMPGGNEMTFSSSKDGTPDLYSMNLSNSKVTRLTSSYSIEVSPAASRSVHCICF
jgi:TolB protein